MANPFVKGWRYFLALFGAKIDEYADPKVQIQQAIEDAQRQHQALVQQAAAVIGNQRQLEMKLSRQMTEVEKLQGQARQALVLADRERAACTSGTTIISPSIDPGVICVRPVPMAIEQAEPGGVNCTKRSSSLTWWS